MTRAATTVLSSPHDDKLSSVCLPFIRTLVDSHLQMPSRDYHTKKTLAFLDVAIIIRKLVLPSWLHHIWNLSLMLLLVWLMVLTITVTH